MSRLRSPNYPSISLPEAITKVKMIYEKEYTNHASREVMVKAMGYSGINGASAVVFSALTKYGLLTSVGSDQYRVSDDALNIILYSKGEPQRFEAIERSASSPQLFADLSEQYPSTLPSDDNLTATLVKKGFNPKWVTDIVRNYRETVEFVRSESSHPVPPEIHGQTLGPVGNAEPDMSAESVSVAGSVLSFKISRDSDVQIRFSGKVTQEAITKLISLLDLSKDVYPTREELSKGPETEINIPEPA
jgi:hypothetical protein